MESKYGHSRDMKSKFSSFARSFLKTSALHISAIGEDDFFLSSMNNGNTYGMLISEKWPLLTLRLLMTKSCEENGFLGSDNPKEFFMDLGNQSYCDCIALDHLVIDLLQNPMEFCLDQNK